MVFACALGSAPLTQAQDFVDIFLGASKPPDTVVTVRHTERASLFVEPTITTTTRRVAYDTSVSLAARIGHWFETKPRLGWAADLSLFGAESEELNADIVALSASLFYRWSMSASAGSRFEPYIGVGAGVFEVDVSTDLRPNVPLSFDVTSQDFAYQFHVGVSRRVGPWTTIILEYRYWSANDPIDTGTQYGAQSLVPPVSDRLQTELESHFLLAGVSFRY